MSIASKAIDDLYTKSLTEVATVTGVTYTIDATTPVFTLKTNPPDRVGDKGSDFINVNIAGAQSLDEAIKEKITQGLYERPESNVQEDDPAGVRESHELGVGDKIKIIRIPSKDPDTSKSSALIEDREYIIATVPSDGEFTLEGDIDTSGEVGENPVKPLHYRTIEYKPITRGGQVIEEAIVELFGNEFDFANISSDSWFQAKLGNNPIFTAMATQAAIASALLSVNIQLVQKGLDLSKVLLLAALNPQLLLLIAIADEIDKFVQDFKATGFGGLTVMATSFAVTIPKSADGNDIELVSSGATMLAAYEAAIAAGIQFQGRTAKGKAELDVDINHTKNEFEKWAFSEDGLNLDGFYPTVKLTYDLPGFSFRERLAKPGNFSIPQGATSAQAVGAIKTDMMMKATAGPFGFLPRMTPSQVIATMISAMNDRDDPIAPNFSDSADVAAVIIIVGVPDFEKTAADTIELLDLLRSWFGEESPAMEAVKIVTDKVREAQDFLLIPKNGQTEIKVSGISGVRGGSKFEGSGVVSTAPSLALDQEDFESALDAIRKIKNNEKESRNRLREAAGSSWTESGYYNFKNQFEVGDLIAGPVKSVGAKLGGKPERALAYVSEVKDTVEEPDNPLGDFNFYQTQTLVINGVTTFDREAFDNSGAGVMIQNVAYVQTEDGVEIDYNSGGLRPIGADISYKHMSQLTEEEAGEVPLVNRTPGKYLLSVVGTKSVTEYHGGSSYRTHNLVAGRLEEPNAGKKPFAVPPNFSGYNLGTLLPPMKELFIQIQKFTDGLRSLAAGTLDTINRIYEFLNDIIKELKKFVAIIQKILKLFTDGLPAAGVYSLLIPSTSGGNNAIIKALKSAAGRPPNSLDFSMGLMFVGGAAAIDPLLLLLGSGGGAGGTAESRLE